ncbi:DUF1266 domain-containing protein [Xenorhabdus bharatensis]|uniref:DUF1266 domain-containing protein n=1 Tax=Xenorhabdus bharatensis TaxID=3136256 RepID=UPI0030F3870F
MKELLQNHPNNREFPVNSFRIVKASIERNKNMDFLNPLKTVGLRILWITTILVIALSTGITDISIDVDNIPSAGFILSVLLVCFTLFGIFLSIYTFFHVKNLPIAEQKDYYQQAGLSILPEEKRQALRLDIVGSYNSGFWVETLEHYPLKSRILQHNDKYRFFPLSESTPHQSQLYTDWGIVDKEGYLKMLYELWAGMHSKHFAVDSVLADGKMFKELSVLIEESTEYVQQCSRSINGRPPALLWGFDLWRAIVLSRNSFAAGYISEEMAWDNILKTADYVYQLFDSFDEFYTNYRLGNAYWSRDFDRAKKRLENFRFYKSHCDWPIAQLPWPKRKDIFMEEYMSNGFADWVNSVLQEQMENSINDEVADEEQEHIVPHILH